MPRSKMLPTPASSTEIKGQDHSSKLSSLQLTFELPPSAITANEDPKSSSAGPKMSPVSPTLKRPYLQPSETVKARRRSSTAQQKETFALPPPPTKSRRIIQMKPRPQPEETAPTPAPAKGAAGSSSHAKHTAGSGATTTGAKTAGAKKQPSATSAAGRKIARKTAHSLIERRRRSKMNEEFAVLKGLIPACTGEMHKLAILQASIEYVRYLEDCITKLKAQHGPGSPAATTPTEFRPARRRDSSEGEGGGDGDGNGDEERGCWNAGPATDAEEEASEDIEMTDTETHARTFFAAAPTPTPTTGARSDPSPVSPVPAPLAGQTARPRHHSHSSDYQLGSPLVSAGPPWHGYPYPSSALTSPALRPQLEIDHEVSAALLMLGGGRQNPGPARGMSVRDLLSS